MGIKRRNFIKMCGAASLAFLPGVAIAEKYGSAGKYANANAAHAPTGAEARIRKSIRAHFGDSFSVRKHGRSRGLTYADIEHAGNLYTVHSRDLENWKIVASDRSL